MDKSRFSRRTYLRIGALGLATGIAGCADSSTNYPNSTPVNGDAASQSTEDTDPDESTPEIPDTPPAQFKAPSQEFHFYHLPIHDHPPTTLTDYKDGYTKNVTDNRNFLVKVVDEDTVTAIFEQTNVVRNIEVKLLIRDDSNEFITETQLLEATDKDEYEQRTLQFDISHVSLPTNAGSVCDLVGIDTHPDLKYTFLFKRHQFVGIPWNHGPTKWINNENFNYLMYYNDDGRPIARPPRGVQGDPKSTPAGHVEYEDANGERAVFLACRNSVNGEVYGVSCHVDHTPYNRFKSGNVPGRNIEYECHYATEISHLQELGEKTYDTIVNKLGITHDTKKIEALGDLIQAIPYEVDDTVPPTVVLYEQKGDCATKAGLFGAIIQNNPWDIMPAFIDCEINGEDHFTPGINVDDLAEDYSPADNHLVSGNGFNSDYAYYDMTYDARIGQRSRNVSNTSLYDYGDFRNHPGNRSHRPPNY